MERFTAAFKAISARLNALKPDPNAKCFFELMSGAVIWIDERPSFHVDTEQLGSLRMLWNYRTSLLLGSPREEFRELWDLAIAAAPHWPGFLPERREPRSEILAIIPDAKKH